MSALYAQKYPRKEFYYASLPGSSRILITCFYFAMIVSIGMSVVGFHMKTGLSAQSAAEYVRGNEEAGASSGGKMFFAKSKEELADVSHPHLFIQGILLFILGHLFTLVQLRDSTKGVVIAAGFISYLFGIAAPWLIRFVHPMFSWFQIANLFVFSAALVLMMGIPLKEMWRPAFGGKLRRR